MLAVDALQLRRGGRDDQWVEKRSSKERRSSVAAPRPSPSTRYQQEWNDDPIDSSDFQEVRHPRQPGTSGRCSDSFAANEVKLGCVHAGAGRRAMPFGRWQDLPATITTQLPEQFGEFRRLGSGALYRGADPERPEVGDMRIRY
ncbi:MAG: hypothetical protein IPH76_18755, partial [Xanthomonadales bacterium]|nr:hypothetical protein [Xanthomonadales bacterium]